MVFIYNKLWIFIKSLILGLLIIGFLIFKGNIERFFIILLILVSINILKCTKFKVNCILLIFCGLLLGYIVGNSLLYCFVMVYNDEYDNTENYESYEKKMSNTAVLIYSSGEPCLFDSFIVLKNIYSEKSMIHKLNAPIEAFKYKLTYESVGNSKYIDLCNRIKDDLNKRLGVEYDVYLAYFNIEPSVYKEIDKLSREYERIILVPLMLSQSEDCKTLNNIINNNSLNENTDIKTIPFLWKSQKLSRQVVENAVKVADEKKIDFTGIIFLVSNNQSFYEQSVFVNDVISKMEKLKFEKNKMICLKYDNDKNVLLEAIHELKGEGTKNIIIVNSSSLYEDIREQYRMNKIIKMIEKEQLVNVNYINGWRISENLLNELEYKIRITNLKNNNT